MKKISREELIKLLEVARGARSPDILIKDVMLLDLINGGINKTSVAIAGKFIAGIGLEYNDSKPLRVIDGTNKFLTAGFIDSHLHIESSMMHPFEFERLTLPLGTTTAICDPHEITNVLGEKGFEWFLRCSKLTKQNLFVQISSCIPALPGFETNGAEFTLEQMKKYKGDDSTVGLAEMMNFPGVINCMDSVLDKIEEFSDIGIDGHSPVLRGRELNAYLAAGVRNCHETVFLDEAREKLQKGMALLIREGTVAKNLKSLAPVINEFNSMQCMLCTDDRNPFEIFHQGHINYLVKMLINECNVPIHIAYRVASYSAAKHFGMKRVGLVAPGYQADLVLLSDLKTVKIDQVFIKGQLVSELSLKEKTNDLLKKSNPPIENSIKRKPVSSNDFKLELQNAKYNVIEIIPNEILTKKLIVDYSTAGGFNQKDILKIAVVERYGKESKISLGLVKGTNIACGAIASSVAHDSHNIIVIGDNDEAMSVAVNSIIENGGGFSVVNRENNKWNSSVLPLPIAGLLSLDSAESISEKIVHLKSVYKKMNGVLDEPFLQMAFLALPVIPALKLTDRGLMDLESFQLIDLKVK